MYYIFTYVLYFYLKCIIFLPFLFLTFPFVFDYAEENENRKRKSRVFADFAIKRPFLSQIKR